MSLRFVYGRAGSGKTRYCLNELKASIGTGTQNAKILVVPEQFTFQAEKDLVALLNTGGIIKTEVLSFRRLAFRVFNEVGGIAFTHIHPAGKSMVLYRIMDKFKDSLEYFSKSVNQPGFVKTLSTLITEFKRYSVTPQRLSLAGDRLEKDDLLKDKLSELSLMYEAFDKIINERYRDSDDDLTIAAEKLLDSNNYRGAEIWIDGFTDFTSCEYNMISQLLHLAKSVTITLTIDSLKDDTLSQGIFSASVYAYSKLTQIACDNNIVIDPPIALNPKPLYRFSGNPELSHLEYYLDTHPYEAYTKPTKNISLFSSSSIFSEIESVATDILHLCRDEGLRFRDIAVVTGNLSGYEKLIEIVFNEYKIPFFMDRKLDIVNHPLIRLILSALEIFTENWSYESVFRYLKTGLTGIAEDKIYRIENYVLACGIRGSRWTGSEDWNMIPELIPDDKDSNWQELFTDINNTRKAIIKPLMDFRSKTKGRNTAKEYCSALFDFLCTLNVPEQIEILVDEFRKNGELPLANEYSQVWNIVMELFDQTVEVMADETFGIERFYNIIKIGFAEYKIGLIPQSLDQVLTGSVERSKSHEIKALYVLGANDGIFPATGPNEGILSDDDRIKLDKLGVELAKDTRSKVIDQQFQVYRTLTTPSDYLRISWPISDQEGKTLRPSTIISRLRKLFPAISESSDLLPHVTNQEVIEKISSANATFRHLTGALRQKADEKEILPVWRDVYLWYQSRPEWARALKANRQAFAYSNHAKPVSEEMVKKLYGQHLISSVSRLEKYTTCPFAFFVQYGMGVKERKIFKLSAPDTGTFLHTAIERFSSLMDTSCEGSGNEEAVVTWRSFSEEWCENKVSDIIDEMLQNMKGSGISSSKRLTALTVRLKRVVTRAVMVIAEHIRRSSFYPVDYEAGFGDNEKYPPITLTLETGETVRLFGRIDRVDMLKTPEGKYLCIVDYKSGTKDFKLSNVYYGLQLQLITYLDAIWESGSKNSEEPILPGGMLYFKVDDPMIRSDSILTDEELEKAIMKQLRMKGLLLADVKLIKQMDNTINGASVVIPATLNKGDVLGKNSSIATEEQFGLLRKYTRKLLKDLCLEILRGSVPIRPVKDKKGSACTFCSYMPVCQFDTKMNDNTYRFLYEKDKDEIWKLLQDQFNSY
jgi:ATP-dependent helicase/nuclease subunit B